jgi:hypothetical protein
LRDLLMLYDLGIGFKINLIIIVHCVIILSFH